MQWTRVAGRQNERGRKNGKRGGGRGPADDGACDRDGGADTTAQGRRDGAAVARHAKQLPVKGEVIGGNRQGRCLEGAPAAPAPLRCAGGGRVDATAAARCNSAGTVGGGWSRSGRREARPLTQSEVGTSLAERVELAARWRFLSEARRRGHHRHTVTRGGTRGRGCHAAAPCRRCPAVASVWQQRPLAPKAMRLATAGTLCLHCFPLPPCIGPLRLLVRARGWPRLGQAFAAPVARSSSLPPQRRRSLCGACLALPCGLSKARASRALPRRSCCNSEPGTVAGGARLPGTGRGAKRQPAVNSNDSCSGEHGELCAVFTRKGTRRAVAPTRKKTETKKSGKPSPLIPKSAICDSHKDNKLTRENIDQDHEQGQRGKEDNHKQRRRGNGKITCSH